MSAQALAERARLEVPTVSKLLKQLAQAGLVASSRGINGGYRLARAPERITIADIVTAMEGPIGMTECSAHAGLCDHEPHCGVRVNWQRINQAIAERARERDARRHAATAAEAARVDSDARRAIETEHGHRTHPDRERASRTRRTTPDAVDGRDQPPLRRGLRHRHRKRERCRRASARTSCARSRRARTNPNG